MPLKIHENHRIDSFYKFYLYSKHTYWIHRIEWIEIPIAARCWFIRTLTSMRSKNMVFFSTMNGPVGAWIARVYHTFAKINNEEHIWGFLQWVVPKNHWVFPLKMVSTWGVKWGQSNWYPALQGRSRPWTWHALHGGSSRRFCWMMFWWYWLLEIRPKKGTPLRTNMTLENVHY